VERHRGERGWWNQGKQKLEHGKYSKSSKGEVLDQPLALAKDKVLWLENETGRIGKLLLSSGEKEPDSNWSERHWQTFSGSISPKDKVTLENSKITLPTSNKNKIFGDES
jgi:hypothetical protein